MAPIPAPLPGSILSAWKALQDSAKTASNPRFNEFTQEKTTQIGKKSVTYRELKLSPDSATFKQLAEDLEHWQASWGEKPALGDLISLKFTVDMSRAGNASDTSPLPLFIGMHGGGGPEWIKSLRRVQTLAEAHDSNDGEWTGMMDFYKGSIKRGIYVATRGLGSSWDMHFAKASYTLMERLIEDMILFANADPNHVYLLGFSAGGDGVYRLAPRLAQRFAAANMGGGHPGGVQWDNYMNVPICLQIGEKDTQNVKDRSKAVVLSGKELTTRGFENEVFVHPTTWGPPPNTGTYDYWHVHFEWEKTNAEAPPVTPQAPRQNVPVIANLQDWLDKFPQPPTSDNIVQKNTNAVDWVSQDSHVRNPTPQHVIWNIRNWENFSDAMFQNLAGRGQDGKGRSQNYWLDIGVDQYSVDDKGPIIEAKIENSNTITVISAKKYLRILLRPGMVDLSKPVQVKIDGQTLSVPVNSENPAVIKDTLWRNDPYLIFNADIVLNQDAHGAWTATSTPRS